MNVVRQRDFGRLWLGVLINDVGDWMLLVGLPVWVFTLSGSALVTSTVLVVELVPTILFGQFAGVLVDRWDPRRTLVCCGLVQAGVLLPLLLVTTSDLLWIVYVVAAAQATLARLGEPAKARLAPSLVAAEDLTAANSALAVGESVARLAGAPLGGLTVELSGLGGLVLADAASYLISTAVIAGIHARPLPADPAPPTARPGLVREWADGLRVIRRTPPLPGLLLVGALAQLAQGIFVVLFVVFAVEELHGDAGDVGLLRGVQAVGGILGGVLVASLARRASARGLVGWGFLGFGAVSFLTWIGPSVTTALAVYVGLFCVVGVPGVAGSAGALTAVQQAAPGSHLGRVVATMHAVGGGAQALGLLFAGALADRVGVIAILIGQSMVYVACGLLGFAVLRPTRHRRARASHTDPGPPAARVSSG